MPAKSEAQQRLFGMALAAKRGKGSFSGKVQELANSMSAKKLRDFAKTPHEGLPEKKAAIVKSLKRLIEKKAFKIQNAPDSFGPKFHEILANTVGRVNPQNLLAAGLVGQEKALDYLSNPDRKELEKQIAHLKKDKRLKDVLIRLNHEDTFDDWKRMASGKGTLGKYVHPLLYLTRPLQNLMTAASRSNHYDPIANKISLYSKIPEIAHHELGHAKDFNLPSGGAKTLLSVLENNFLPVQAGPVTQWHESNANTEAEKTYKGDMREFRRRLWPARGTYWGALAGGLTALLNPKLREKAMDFVEGTGDNDLLNNPYTRGLLVSAIPTGLGALGGRLVAETRNLFD